MSGIQAYDNTPSMEEQFRGSSKGPASMRDEQTKRGTRGPWYVRDFRASYMRELGWIGPAIDRILITNMTGAEIEACSGADCIVARIQFDNRQEQLGESNLADAHLMAAAPDLLAALAQLVYETTHLSAAEDNGDHTCRISANALAEARAAIEKAITQ